MGKGCDKTEWQLKIDQAYHDWREKGPRNSVKAHFSECNSRQELPDGLRTEYSHDGAQFIDKDLNELRDTFIEDDKENFVRTSLKDDDEPALFIRD